MSGHFRYFNFYKMLVPEWIHSRGSFKDPVEVKLGPNLVQFCPFIYSFSSSSVFSLQF